ncbi:methyl-accepting chemotaxis protein [Pseudobutyrivibrio sp. YE44]|uniref:methyl-accepting chemotaxis protein n=1 Tax=Pseudobutyrivibrio sp. YE44 TaxID=1520802 RepID=UPI000886F692|nr:methyl-accepting chemotaxis protein [Pseudobutyrivibrio sp. YE44]SDB05119.1 methyl-accepting chemotaxis protein [Pseudobutyrivibrio sp. YE44]
MSKEKKEKKIKANGSVSVSNSVKAKLIVSMLSVAAIPLLIAIIVSYITSTTKAKADAIDSLEWQTWYVESQIQVVFENNKSAITSFAESPTTISFMKGEDVDVKDIKEQMHSIDENLGDGNVLVLTNTDGQMVLRDDDGDLTDISHRDFWKEAMAGNFNVSNVIVSNSTGKRSISMAAPIIDPETNKIIGTCHRNYSLTSFHEILDTECDNGYMVDRDGILAAHSDWDITADDEPIDCSSSPYMHLDADEIEGTYLSNELGYSAYTSFAVDKLSGYVFCLNVAEDTILSSARKAVMVVIAIGVVLLIIVFIFSLILANGFTKPILAVNQSLSGLADGSFSKIEEFTNRKDEFGQIVNNTNTVIEKLNEIVGHIKESAHTVGDSAEELSDMANQIAATTDGVSNSVQEIATGAIQQAEEIQQAAENVGKITDAVGGVQNSTNDMESLAARMKEASEASSKSLLTLQKSSSEMTDKIEDIARTIGETQKAVNDINVSVEGISGIASQTNLLSLNASIEAARAGEAGKGFAVVAEEIRKLADDSDHMAQEIREVMDVLLREAELAVTAASQVKQGNIEQQEALGETLESVNGMLADIEETVIGVKKISGGANVCVESNDIVSEAMSSLSAISEENAASSETTGASVQELSATVSSLADSANSLKNISMQLNDEMKFFK